MEILYAELENKIEEKKLYVLVKDRERRDQHIDHIKYIKDEYDKIIVVEVLFRRRCQSYFYKLLNDKGHRHYAGEFGELKETS